MQTVFNIFFLLIFLKKTKTRFLFELDTTKN